MSGVSFDENAIGQHLVLTQGDTILQTDSTVDAHRMARSQYGEGADMSSVEFYIYSPNASNPSLVSVAGVPPLCVGVVTSAAALNKYVGEDAFGWGYCPGDGKVYNNGAALVGTGFPFPTSTFNDYITVFFDPIGGFATWLKNGNFLGSVYFTPGTMYYAATVSGNKEDLAIWANASQTPPKYPVGTNGWQHKAIGIVPLFLATEPYITKSTDTLPNLKFNGDIDRSQTPPTIQRGVVFWPWGASKPSALGKGTQISIHLLDPDKIYGELITSDIRDQIVTLQRMAQGAANNTAEAVFTGVIDHCEQNTDQTKTLYANDKQVLLQSQLIRPLFAPNANVSVAGKPRPMSIGICRTYTPSLYDTDNLYYAASDEPLSAVGKNRIAGRELGAGIDYSNLPDAEGFSLPEPPAGKFTAETTDYGGSFLAGSADLLAGSGLFGSATAQVGTYAGQPVGWTGDGGYYGQDPKNTVWQLSGAAPNKVISQSNVAANAIYTLKHNTVTITQGRSYAYKIVVTAVPSYGPGIDPVNGAPVESMPAELCLGGFPNANSLGYIQVYPWKRFRIPTVGTYKGTFTNTLNATLPFVLGFITNTRIAPGGAFVSISSIEIDELPALTQNVILTGPPLAVILRQLLIDRGPFETDDYDATSAEAIDALTGYQYGLHVSENESPQLQTCAKRILDSCCADIYVNRAGKVTTVQLTAPEAPGVVPVGTLTVNNIQGYLQPYPDMAENLTTRLQGCKNYDPYSESDFSSVSLDDVPLLVRKQLELEYQWTAVAGVKLAARYNAADSAAPLPSQFDLLVDGQKASTAVAKLYTVNRTFYTGAYFSPLGTQFEIGQVWNVVYPLAGLETGRQLMIVGITEQPSESLSMITFWGL